MVGTTRPRWFASLLVVVASSCLFLPHAHALFSADCQDVTQEFPLGNGDWRTCSWVAEFRRLRRCSRKLPNGSTIGETFCPVTCEQCPPPSDDDDDSWSFLVVADWHHAEPFVKNPGNQTDHFQARLQEIQHVHQTYQGDLVVLPGDSNDGKWQKPEFAQQFLPELTVPERIVQAGKNCYGTMREVWAQGGYNTMLMATGDHEMGDNPWNSGKADNLQYWREGFQDSFNRNATTGAFLFDQPIGSEPSRPMGTVFENTSYAVQHKNILFVTVDVYKTRSIGTFDRETGLGADGFVTATVDGAHLEWFRSVLGEARKDSSIQHIFVQSHTPAAYPVRKLKSSGMMLDHGEESSFWETMVEFEVDIYLAGEVHTNTVTKDKNSNLLQVVSRGNRLSQFLRVHATEKTLEITSYRLFRSSGTYQIQGSLLVDKTSESSTTFQSSGVLELLDREAPLIHVKFDELAPKGFTVDIRGKDCNEQLPNKGVFGGEYTPDVTNVQLVEYNDGGGSFGRFFGEESRCGILRMGPHTGGYAISFSLWFQAYDLNQEMILVHYGASNLSDSDRDMFTLTLKKGMPILYLSPTHKLRLHRRYRIRDTEWHHIAVSMPRNHCRLSEVQIFLDGRAVDTLFTNDNFIFFAASGQVSLGGFGFSSDLYDQLFPGMKPFEGGMDEFLVWAKPLTAETLQSAMEER